MNESDRDELGQYLGQRLGAEVLEVDVLGDGLNLVVAVRTENQRYTLRRPNKLRDTYYMNGVREEYDILEALSDTEVPAPDPVFFEPDGSVLGRPFFVCRYLPGETVPLGSKLPERFRTERARAAIGERLIDTLAAIHTEASIGIEDRLEGRSPRETLALASDRIEAASAATGHDPLALEPVLGWLRRNAPSDPEATLVHGDFRPGNVLFSGEAIPEITGVLDWETAGVGDPLADLGYLLLRWGDESDATPSLSVIEARHPDAEDAVTEMARRNDGGLAPFTSEPGSPGREALVERYESRTGLSYENDRFYRAYTAFLVATVWADLHRHSVEAGADSEHAHWIDYMLATARAVIDGDQN